MGRALHVAGDDHDVCGSEPLYVLKETTMDLETAANGINFLVTKAHEISKAKGWHDEGMERSVGEDIALMHSELSEALEDFRAGRFPAEVYSEGEKPCGIPVELADVLIRIFDFCGKHEIDLGSSVLDKMQYNATRPHRHGGKKL